MEAILGGRRNINVGVVRQIAAGDAEAVLPRDFEADLATARGYRDLVGAASPVAPTLEAIPYVVEACFVGNCRGRFRPDAVAKCICGECPRDPSPLTAQENPDPIYVRVDEKGRLCRVSGGEFSDSGPAR